MEQTQPMLASVVSRLGWLLRFVLFLLTGGFAYPHVCTEGMKLK